MKTAEQILKFTLGKECFNSEEEDFKQAIYVAMEEYANQDKWVGVDERLAEKGEKVLVFFDYGDKQTIEIDECSIYQKATFITKWQPLPNPPKDK